MPLDDTRVFVQLIPVVDSGEEDYLTKFRIHKYDVDNVLLVGLPAIQITGKHQYMVPVKLRDSVKRFFQLAPPANDSIADTLLPHVDWDVQFA